MAVTSLPTNTKSCGFLTYRNCENYYLVLVMSVIEKCFSGPKGFFKMFPSENKEDQIIANFVFSYLVFTADSAQQKM